MIAPDNNHTIFGVPYLDPHAVALRADNDSTIDTWLQQWGVWLQTGYMADWVAFNAAYRAQPDVCDSALVPLWGLAATADFTARLIGLRVGAYPRYYYVACYMWHALCRRGLALLVDMVGYVVYRIENYLNK
jgi:hypothetical protein